MDFLSYKLRCYTRISALKKGVTTQGKKYFFHVCLTSPISAVRATRSGFYLFFFTFSHFYFSFSYILQDIPLTRG